MSVTFDPNRKSSSIILSEDYLSAWRNYGDAWGIVNSTKGCTSGKYYVELTSISSATQIAVGIGTINTNWETYGGATIESFCFNVTDAGDGRGAVVYNDGSGVVVGPYFNTSITAGTVFGLLINVDTKTVSLTVNGELVITHTHNISGEIFPQLGLSPSAMSKVNFGATNFVYTPPIGYSSYESTAIEENNNKYLRQIICV